jgi:hypothetical protein
MKFIKRLPLDNNDPMSDRFAVLADDRIVTNTKVALQLPKGTDLNRPAINVNGQIRYNETINEFEVYNGTSPGTGWEKVRTVRPAPIYVQQLGNGDYTKTDFGPLRWGTGENYTNFTNPQNIFVYIENVFQIPVVNYSLIQNAGTVSIRFTSAPPTKPVYAYLGIDGYFPPFPAP